MEDKKMIKIFNTVVLAITVVTLVLSMFFDSAFIPSFMLMLALFIFGICYYIKDNEKKIRLYGLFTLGILLIVGSLAYTFMRLS